MEEVIKIAHKNYEKITDDLMWLSKNWMLKFTVILNRYTDKYGKQNYHKEVGYYNKDGEYCININRSFDYYVTIDSVGLQDKESVAIRQTDLYLFKFKLGQVAEWFTGHDNQGLFAKKDGQIIMPRSVNPIRISDLAFNSYIEFEPSIMTLNSGEQFVGIRMYINSDVNSVFMEISRFLAFKDFINTFNMYESAQLMLNYLQRPEYGTNIYNVNNKPPKRGGRFLG